MPRTIRPLLGRTFPGFVVTASFPDKTCRIFCFACQEEKVFPKKSIYRLKSCGCLRNELIRIDHTKHGHKRKNHRTPEYVAFVGMHARCNNPKNPEYFRYGGRGVKVCKRWSGENGFIRFLSDMDLKPSPKLSLDRKKPTGNYTPFNTRWADARTQRLNQRRTKKKRSLDSKATLAVSKTVARKVR